MTATTRHRVWVERIRRELTGAAPVIGFLLALGAAALQTAWWLSHGWTWPNLIRFLDSGPIVAWTAGLVVAAGLVSWIGFFLAESRAEPTGRAVAALMTSVLAAIPIVLTLVLVVLALALISTLADTLSDPPPRDDRPHRRKREPRPILATGKRVAL